jgi:hypothetical protein
MKLRTSQIGKPWFDTEIDDAAFALAAVHDHQKEISEWSGGALDQLLHSQDKVKFFSRLLKKLGIEIDFHDVENEIRVATYFHGQAFMVTSQMQNGWEEFFFVTAKGARRTYREVHRTCKVSRDRNDKLVKVRRTIEAEFLFTSQDYAWPLPALEPLSFLNLARLRHVLAPSKTNALTGMCTAKDGGYRTLAHQVAEDLRSISKGLEQSIVELILNTNEVE